MIWSASIRTVAPARGAVRQQERYGRPGGRKEHPRHSTRVWPNDLEGTIHDDGRSDRDATMPATTGKAMGRDETSIVA